MSGEGVIKGIRAGNKATSTKERSHIALIAMVSGLNLGGIARVPLERRKSLLTVTFVF